MTSTILASLLPVFLWFLPSSSYGCYKFSADIADPCLSVECQYGAECRPSSDGSAGQCQCPGRCPTYGDSRGSHPVCGTDGQDYPNVCELRRVACRLQTDIEVKFEGRCDPCEGVECPASQVCQLDARRRPVCRCNAVCAPDFRPVCGSDGRTYVNECALRVEACKSRRGLRIIFSGECDAGASPCENLQCGPGQECDIDRYGIAACQCPQACEPVVRPVCGDDGKTYHSECDMRRSGCLEQKVINLEHRGACGAPGTCFDYPCPREAECLMESRRPVCRCPVCPEIYDPVCGNDGRTYTSECSLRREACEQNKDIKVAYQEICSGCEHKHCEYYAICESDTSGAGKCICPKDCIKYESPVCGTDGVTYQNECEMRVAACEKEQYIMVGSRGPCDLCQNVHCMHGARCERGRCICQFDCPDDYDPVCGSDGSTYRNDCEMRRGACTKAIHLSTVFYGECDRTLSAREDHAVGLPVSTCQIGDCRFGGVCEKDHRGFGHCVCNFRCQPISDESVCGSDNRFYDSECKLREESCRLQQDIHVVPQDMCAGSGCRCHRLGSWTDNCDGGQCECRPGVGGERCDRCEPGYWGLHKIASDGNLGCLPCECHALGSARDDCEQTTGRCACRHGVRGDKCDSCEESMMFAQDGICLHKSLSQTFEGPCGPLSCKFGATCREIGNRFSCSCTQRCPPIGWLPVCGSDGITYASPCFMELFGCRQQTQIQIVKDGPCKPGDIAVGGEEVSPTAGPVRRSTVHKTTWDHFELKSTHDFGNSEHLYLSTGPTTSGPPADDAPVEIPAFSGISFLELPRLQAYTRLSLELEFRSFGGDGIILYNGQSASGAGDFVSLAVRDGYVEFRYDLGSGPVILRSPQRLQEGRFHRLVAKRYLRDGVLTLDGQRDVSGHSEGALKSLDLAENMFLGFVPTGDEGKKIFENIGTSEGLVGCIRRLRVGQRDVNLSYPISNDLLRGRNIRECRGRPCNSIPCRNGGSCVPGDPDTFQCACPEGFSGSLCQISQDPCSNSPCINGATCVTLPDHEFTCLCDKDYKGRFCEHNPTKPVPISEVFIPEFDGTTFLELPTLANAGQELVIEIWFLSISVDGVLVYNDQESLGRGDFVCLNIANGYIHFLYDLGSGIANITSLTPITLGRWHVVRASRIGRKGSLQLDDGELALGESKGPLSELNLDRSLYLGGYRHLSTVNPESGITDRFRGAIQRLFVNRELLELRKVAQASLNVRPFRGFPCAPNPCSNGGICLPQLNNFHCKCASGYGDLWCDKYIANISTDESVSFDGKTFLKFPEKLSRSDTHSRIEVVFRTEMDIPSQSLILLRKQESTLLGGHAMLALALVDGHLEASLGDGSGSISRIRHSVRRLDDNQWHTTVFDRHNDYSMLQVDENVVTAWTPMTEADGPLWIGGCSTVPPGLPSAYYFGFIGCLHAVIVDDEALKITGQPCTARTIEKIPSYKVLE